MSHIFFFFEFRSELALGVLGSGMSIRSFPRLYSWVNSPQYDKKVGQETKHTLTVRSQHTDKICGVESLRTTLWDFEKRTPIARLHGTGTRNTSLM